MVLYKIKTGTISSPVNLVSIPSSLTVSFQSNTQVILGSCSLSASFTAGLNQGDWLPLGVAYTGQELRAYRYGEVQSQACSGEALTVAGTLSLSQGASGVDISYAYIYLFSDWFTPGEVLYYSFRKMPYYFITKILISGYSFYDRNPSQ